jgi:hypothetical protein
VSEVVYQWHPGRALASLTLAALALALGVVVVVL